jgi:hypothetical protein
MYEAFEELVTIFQHEVSNKTFQSVFEFFNIDCVKKKYILGEIKHFKTQFNGVEKSTLKAVFDLLFEKKETFPLLYDIYHQALTIAVSSSEGERTFSALNRILDPLRATMSQRRLSSLTILSIESEFIVDIDDVLKKFCSAKKRRLELVKE